MSWVEVLPPAPSKSEPIAATRPLFVRPAEYVPYVPPLIPDAVPVTTQEVIVFEPAPVPNTQLSQYSDPQLGWWGSWCRDRARNKLQRTLARIIQISQDHEANGVKPGDHIYQHLYNKALALCHGYFDTWHLNRDHIEIEIPCMRQLRLAAYPEASAVTGSSRVFFGFLAVIVLPMVIGVWTGLFGIGQRWIMHLFGG